MKRLNGVTDKCVLRSHQFQFYMTSYIILIFNWLSQITRRHYFLLYAITDVPFIIPLWWYQRYTRCRINGGFTGLYTRAGQNVNTTLRTLFCKYLKFLRYICKNFLCVKKNVFYPAFYSDSLRLKNTSLNTSKIGA